MSDSSRPITGVDHCIVLVHDLDAARTTMESLGFLTAPRGVHSAHMGTHNRCVMLERGYFEVMAVLTPTAHNERWRAALERREGLAAIALETDDAVAARNAFAARGVEAPETIEFGRPIALPGGEAQASFAVAGLPGAATGDIAMFACQHFTRDVVWHPAYLEHPNRCRALLGVLVVADEPSALAWLHARVLGADAPRETADGATVDLGRGTIEYLTADALPRRLPGAGADPRAASPYVAGLSLATADIEAARACLHGKGVGWHDLDRNRLYLSAADACGALIELVGD